VLKAPSPIWEAKSSCNGEDLASAARRKRDDDATQPKERGGNRKALVVTAVELGGEARAKRVGTHCERTITTFLLGNVSPESVPFTDELPGCRLIGGKFRHICASITLPGNRFAPIRTLPLRRTPPRQKAGTPRSSGRLPVSGIGSRSSVLIGDGVPRAGNAGRLPWKALLA
jgi:hypothetical protein